MLSNYLCAHLIHINMPYTLCMLYIINIIDAIIEFSKSFHKICLKRMINLY